MKASATQRTVAFIVSEGRSGSTWLSYVLGSHTGAAHLGEYYRPFTMPGHVACRLCEARGRTECEILHGIENVPKEHAYDFAFERFHQPILIDASKILEWVVNFLHQERFQVRVIHLMRDPRGWFASEGRRDPALLPDVAITRWLDTNNKVIDLLASHHVPCFSVFYDDLAVHPERHFPPLCSFVGMRYESGALDYWNYEHHGLGGNGAAFNVIGKYEGANVITGDNPFYRTNTQRHFYDTRWLRQLSGQQRRAFEQSAAVRDLLARYDRDFSHFDALRAECEERVTARSWGWPAAAFLAQCPRLLRRLATCCIGSRSSVKESPSLGPPNASG